MPLSNDSWASLVSDISRLLRRTFERKMLGIPLTLGEARALYYVSQNEGIRQVDLAELLEIQPIQAARLIDKLQALRLVIRQEDAQDRRANKIFIQPAAKPILAQFEAVAGAIRIKATEGLNLEQIQVLTDILLKIRANIHAI